MLLRQPGLFGIKNSNRDFTQRETWGENQFNSSFPAALASYLSSRGIENVYLYLDKQLKVRHGYIKTSDFYGIEPTSDDLFYSFESSYTPFQQLLIGNLPRVDLVTQSKSSGQVLRPIEIKLTALPDNSTCEFSEDRFGTEIVVRPDTIVYLACSIAINFKDCPNNLKNLIGDEFDEILDWTEGHTVW